MRKWKGSADEMRRLVSVSVRWLHRFRDPVTESEWKELKKAKFEGKTISGIELPMKLWNVRKRAPAGAEAVR